MADDSSQESLDTFFDSLKEFNPVIPDELVEYYLRRSGFECPDIRVKRMISLAAQKFISEIANDSLQYCKIRQQNPLYRDKNAAKEKRYVLTTEDLAASMKEYGISIKKPEYYANSIATAAATTATSAATGVTAPTTLGVPGPSASTGTTGAPSTLSAASAAAAAAAKAGTTTKTKTKKA